MNFPLSHCFRAEILLSGARYAGEKYDVVTKPPLAIGTQHWSAASIEKYVMASLFLAFVASQVGYTGQTAAQTCRCYFPIPF
jgi:hypothetical protein